MESARQHSAFNIGFHLRERIETIENRFVVCSKCNLLVILEKVAIKSGNQEYEPEQQIDKRGLDLEEGAERAEFIEDTLVLRA